MLLQRRSDGKAAKRFFKRLLKAHRMDPRKIVTDKLRSYGVAHNELIPESIHDCAYRLFVRVDTAGVFAIGRITSMHD